MTPAAEYSSINIVLVQAREAVLSYFRPVFNEAGITEQQWRIIRLLAEHSALDFQEIATKTCILRPSLTGMLGRMEQAGMVARFKHDKDQRRVFVKLTANGKRLYEQYRDKVAACRQELERAVGSDVLNGLLDGLQRILPKTTDEQD